MQEKYSPNAICFGCGPSNPHGLHIKSIPDVDDVLVSDWTPEPYHTGYAGFTNGGIISTLVDCHGNMTAAYALMKAKNLESPPSTVTAELTVKFLKPTPIGSTVHLKAHANKIEGSKVYVEGTVEANGVKTVLMNGVYVEVKKGHPGFGKWS